MRTHAVLPAPRSCSPSMSTPLLMPTRTCSRASPVLFMSTLSKNLGTSPALMFIARKFGTGAVRSSNVLGLWYLRKGYIERDGRERVSEVTSKMIGLLPRHPLPEH